MQPAQSSTSAANFVKSELFSRTFKEGMTLVEETANYLDGAGRETSKTLSRSSALAYAGASMRLTTLLMQIASWLLVLRAVREGELKADEAHDDKYRLKPRETIMGDLRAEGVPETLINLIEQTGVLYGRIARIDADLFGRDKTRLAERDAHAQQRALLEAFGRAKAE